MIRTFFIYLANGTLDRKLIADQDIAHASITKIEALGFSRIHANELLLLETLFEESYNLPLTEDIVERAIKLRQAKSMSLGEAIMAASALEHDYELWTANAAVYDSTTLVTLSTTPTTFKRIGGYKHEDARNIKEQHHYCKAYTGKLATKVHQHPIQQQGDR